MTNPTIPASGITPAERKQIAEILSRRANEIASYSDEYRKNPAHYGSVELALSREIDRLRFLEGRVNPTEANDE